MASRKVLSSKATSQSAETEWKDLMIELNLVRLKWGEDVCRAEGDAETPSRPFKGQMRAYDMPIWESFRSPVGADEESPIVKRPSRRGGHSLQPTILSCEDAIPVCSSPKFQGKRRRGRSLREEPVMESRELSDTSDAEVKLRRFAKMTRSPNPACFSFQHGVDHVFHPNTRF